MEVGVAKKLSISIFFVRVDCEVFFFESNERKTKEKNKERERKRGERRKRFD